MAQPSEAAYELRSSACPIAFTQAQHRDYARSVLLGRTRLTEKAQDRLLRMRLCQRTPEAQDNARRLIRRLRRLRRRLPYACPPHGRFAIPCSVIRCESKFNWKARNPSGAWGVYQLLGWLPYGSSREAQHRVAARLWRSGAGRSHWVCA